MGYRPQGRRDNQVFFDFMESNKKGGVVPAGLVDEFMRENDLRAADAGTHKGNPIYVVVTKRGARIANVQVNKKKNQVDMWMVW